MRSAILRRGACLPALLVVLAGSLVAPVAGAANEGVEAGDFEGVWMPPRVSRDDPRWRLVDLACDGCAQAGFQYMQRLLDDPRSDERSIRDLRAEADEHDQTELEALLTPAARKAAAEFDLANDPAIDCSPDGDGIKHQITAPIPFQIEHFDDHYVFRYEYWNAVRIVYLDGREPPADFEPSRLGFSVGRFDGDTLVVETTHLKPSLLGGRDLPIELSPDARVVERYTLTDDGERLDLVLSIIDPHNFREPYVDQQSTLRSPGWELEEYVCEATTGEF